MIVPALKPIVHAAVKAITPKAVEPKRLPAAIRDISGSSSNKR
jgi:hypothetical protein